MPLSWDVNNVSANLLSHTCSQLGFWVKNSSSANDPFQRHTSQDDSAGGVISERALRLQLPACSQGGCCSMDAGFRLGLASLLLPSSRRACKGLILGFTISHISWECWDWIWQWPVLCGFQLLFPVEFKAFMMFLDAVEVWGVWEQFHICSVSAGWLWLQPGPCPMASMLPKELSQLPLEGWGPTLGPKPPNAFVGHGHHTTLRSNQPNLVYQMYLLLVGGRESLVKNIKDKILSEPGSLRFVLSKIKMFDLFPLDSFCVFPPP